MRTAEEYFNEFIGEGIRVYNESDEKNAKYYIEKAINEARKEAIEECAERAKVEAEYLPLSEVYVCAHSVDKQSILSLINELK